MKLAEPTRLHRKSGIWDTPYFSPSRVFLQPIQAVPWWRQILVLRRRTRCES